MTSEPGPKPIPVIIETDIFADVDDVGALAVAHEAADRGAADLLAVGVNTRSRWGHRAVAVINAFFGRPVPVGVLAPSPGAAGAAAGAPGGDAAADPGDVPGGDAARPGLFDDSVAERDYARLLATRFAADAPTGAEPELAVVVHRRALASAADRSVTVISLGFLTNLRDLLDTGPDAIDDRAGPELVAAKVDRLVIMGGRFPEGREFNFEQDVPAATAVLERWPGPVELLGFEVGAPVITGAGLSAGAADTPVGAAYRAYCGAGVGRESWDPLTVHLAVTHDPELFALSGPGRVRLAPDGTSRFVPEPDGPHRITRAVADPERAAAVIDGILTRAVAGHRREPVAESS